MKSPRATVGAVLLGFALLFVALERPSWLPRALSAPAEAPVLVFLVGDRAGIERVRRAVDPTRIVHESDDALALDPGRILATDVSAVSRPLGEAGWTDRRIEIFHVERADPFERPEEGPAGVETDPERLARLRELVKKPTLSYGEQLFVLQAMNEGIEF